MESRIDGLDLWGFKFDKLLVIGYKGKDSQGNPLWACICDCGRNAIRTSEYLLRSRAAFCGYRHSKATDRVTKGSYSSWAAMKQRCYNPRHKHYNRYGGRGITVCPEWHDFEGFYKDMGVRPLGMSLDRINNDGNYEPFNCRWATPKQQANNHSESDFTKLALMLVVLMSSKNF